MNPSGRNEQLNCSANVHRPRTSRNGDSGRARFRGSKGLSPKYRCDCQGGNADGDCVFGKDVVICYGDLYPWVKREAGYLLASDQADEPAYRRVLAGYDMVSAALVSLQEQARIKEIPGSEERTRAIARSCVESPEKLLIVSPDNASRRELNDAVRHELKANGTLTPEDHRFRVLVQRQDMTYAERSWAGYYEINDVVAMHAVARPQESMPVLMERLSASIPPPTCDPRRLSGVSGYHEIAREFSLGDHIQFTAPDKSLGVANRDLATIESFTPDGRIAARLDDNRQIGFNAQEHRHFDHGYAVTSHSSQGLTAERVLVNADTGVHPDLLNSRFGYVSISRASHEAMLFTDDVAKLSPSLQPMYQRPRLLKSSSLCPLDRGLEWVDPFPRIFQTPSPGHWPTCSSNVTSIT